MSPRPFRLLALTLSLSLVVAAPHAATAADAPELESRADILIERDTEFDAAHGVRSGRGTAASPYVIEGWRVNNIRIHDTQSHVVIRHNEIAGRLTLDWIGPHVTVVRNVAGDLRVNQNVARSGRMTGGRIAHNTFGVVGQLRHFDGVFEHNLVGSPATGGMFGDGTESAKAVQFDGFNGARFRDNTVYGFVDVKLHGHHHGSAFGASSHDHAGEATHESTGSHDHGAGHEGTVDHSKRYHEVWVTGNTIHSSADYALRYDDVGHAGNDRTAASETDERLNDPHVHFTRVHLVGNRLVGAGLVVQVFNATDDHHRGTRRGLVDVRANRIALGPSQFGDLFGGRDGIRVLQVIDAEVRVVANVIEGTPREGLAASEMFRSFDGSAGIRLQTLDRASVYVDRNRVTQRAFGVVATQLTKTVRWWVRGLSTSEVGQDVSYDDSVANPPNRG